jgi:DNA-binding transcriptional LysR family regulator
MNYTLNQLRVYTQVVHDKSITKAALTLHLSQPAVSIQLKNFTSQFDIPLIEIINKRICITDFGKEIADAATIILNEVDAIEHKMHAYQGLLTGKLKLSIVSTGKYIAPYFIAEFIEQHPGIELSIDVTNKTQVLDSLDNNDVDFSLVSILPKDNKYHKVELMPNKLYLVGGAKNQLEKKTYGNEIFKQIQLIYREIGSGTREVMENYIAKHKLPVIKKMELKSNEAVKQAVMAGLGYSIMPLIGIKNEINNKQLEIIPVKGFPIQSTWNMICLKNKTLSPVAQAFLNFIKREKQRIIQEKFNEHELL